MLQTHPQSVCAEVEDENGGMKTEEHGKIYYINGYNGRGIRIEDGYLTLPWTPGKKSFSVAFWVKSDGVKSDPTILSDLAHRTRQDGRRTAT